MRGRVHPIVRCALICASCLALGGVAAAAPDDNEAPVANRPPGYLGAVGSFRVTATAEPRELQAEDPLTFTVRVTGTGRVGRRPNLKAVARFSKHFRIDDLPDDAARSSGPVWEFRYRLRPRSADVMEVATFLFDYYDPRLKHYRQAAADQIPLKVRPRGSVSAADVQGPAAPVQAPTVLYELAEGPAVLRHDEPFRLPGPLGLALLLLGPPAVAAAWYVGWRLHHPEAAWRARRRQSRAARQALLALDRLRNGTPAGAPAVAAVVAAYLRQRVELSAAEPTPAEVRARLREWGCSPPVADRTAEFFRQSDAARFGPPGTAEGDGVAAAGDLIRLLEGQPWSLPPS